MKTFYGLLVLGAYLSTATAHGLPKEYQRCKAEDSACIVERTNEIIRGYPDSFTKLKLEKIEPMTIKSIRFAGNPNTPVNLDFTMTDLQIHGLSNVTVTKFEGFTKDPKNIKQITNEGSTPKLHINGKYKMSGKLLLVPINGEGDINIAVKNLQYKYLVKPKLEVRDGKTYLKSESPKCKAKADGMVIEPENLFQGQKSLADSTIKVLNDNWQVLWDEISPQFCDEIKLKISSIMDSLADHSPYEEIFL